MSKETTNINIRIDTHIKKQAEELFNDLGMNMTTAINIFVKQAIRQGGIPFIIGDESLNRRTLEAISDVENNVNISKEFDDIQDLMSDLNA